MTYVQNENINKEIETIKKEPNGNSGLKNKVTELKSSIGSFNIIINQNEERIRKLKDRGVKRENSKIIQPEE